MKTSGEDSLGRNELTWVLVLISSAWVSYQEPSAISRIVHPSTGILFPRNGAYVAIHGERDFANVVKDFEMGRLDPCGSNLITRVLKMRKPLPAVVGGSRGYRVTVGEAWHCWL